MKSSCSYPSLSNLLITAVAAATILSSNRHNCYSESTKPPLDASFKLNKHNTNKKRHNSNNNNNNLPSSSRWGPTQSYLNQDLRSGDNIDDILNSQRDSLMESFLSRTQRNKPSESSSSSSSSSSRRSDPEDDSSTMASTTAEDPLLFDDDNNILSDNDGYFPGLDDKGVASARVSSRRARKTKRRGFDYYNPSSNDGGAGDRIFDDEAFFEDLLQGEQTDAAETDTERGIGGGGHWVGGGDDDDSNSDWEREYGEGSEKGALYDAYNLLHNLAQDFQKPFDAPAVLVVGQQSSGKSALLEALMGFQFNQVGGGTKTRRPIALRMQYDPRCHRPRCYLRGDDGVERPQTLAQLRAYIESENRRLERDPVRCFDAREIHIRMEYKYCPNMILIDTPGLINAPRLSKDRGSRGGLMGSGGGNVQQRALVASAREAERLVLSKMKCKDYLILCVEDTSDWKHGAVREVVQRADPDLSRTIIVNTKLDTKVPQFGTAADVMEFLRADIIDRLSPHKLGGPFFTSVPAGRVGDLENEDAAFESNEEFVAACADYEDGDRGVVEQRLKNLSLGPNSPLTAAGALLPRVGISQLREFLEKKVDDCYRKNVAKILPLLQAEHGIASKRLAACEKELEALSLERLKAGADFFCDSFCACLKEAIQGSIIAPPSLFGESLGQENLAAGSFHEIPNCPMAVDTHLWTRLVTTEVGNTGNRLYGGAQYHRTLREFNLATRCLRLPIITQEEIANAAGVGETHDGVNFLRASCVIAFEKARTSFEPLLDMLRHRMVHVMGRLYGVSEYMLRQKQERRMDGGIMGDDDLASKMGAVGDITHSPQFRQMIQTIFEGFVEKCSESAMKRCRDDLIALTRFVTWDLHERGGGALRRSLPDQTDIVAVYQVAVKAADTDSSNTKSKKFLDKANNNNNNNNNNAASSGDNQLDTHSSNGGAGALTVSESAGEERDYYNLVQLMEEAACSRDANRTSLVVSGLVQHIVAQWRETFGKATTIKFNCFFLMPFVDEFHRYLRQELQKVYDGEGNDSLLGLFDLSTVRRTLMERREELRNECAANKRLQDKFDMVNKMMQRRQREESSSSVESSNSSIRERRTNAFGGNNNFSRGGANNNDDAVDRIAREGLGKRVVDRGSSSSSRSFMG